MPPHSDTNGHYKVIESENGSKVSDVNKHLEAGRCRKIFPQVIASVVRNFLQLDIGVSDAFPVILIPALRGLNNENNFNEMITLTAAQASWLGSVSSLFKLFGSISSGWVTEPLGRKKAMLFVSIPHVIAWMLLSYSTTLTEVFLAQIFLGVGIGLMQAPITAYVSEICEPSIRGILMATSGIFMASGYTIVLLLGSLTAWRGVATVCLTLPIVTIVAVSFIPETPMWLLSKNRETDAIKSLQWLRGWVSEKAVQREFDEVKRYSKNSSACAVCTKAKQKCLHPPPGFKQQLIELVRKKTLKPFFILITTGIISQFCVLVHLMPYMVQILNAYGSPISPNWATVIVGASGIFSTITCVITVKFVGKRKIYLITLTMACLSNIALGIYGFYSLPSGCTSYDCHNSATETVPSYFPLIIFLILNFCTVGVTIVPVMMLGELFPFKSRGLATGLTRAAIFVSGFVAAKSFYNIETWLSLQGAMCFYGGISLIGLIVAYNILPETENRTLEDIENHFSDNQRKFIDRKIEKVIDCKKILCNVEKKPLCDFVSDQEKIIIQEKR